MLPEISHDLCDGCGTCIEACPTGALTQQGHSGCGKCVKYCTVLEVPCAPAVAVLLPDRCDGCGTCASVCPAKAISMRPDGGQSAAA